MASSPLPDFANESAEVVTSIVVKAPRADNAGLSRIDFAQLADRQFLVYGWVLGFANSVEKAWIDLGGVIIDLSKQTIPVRRPDVAQHFSLETGNDEHGFYALIDLPEKIEAIDRLALFVTLSSGETAETSWPVTHCDSGVAEAVAPHAAVLRRLLPNLPRREAKRLVVLAGAALGEQVEEEFLTVLPPPVRFEIDLCTILENRILVISGFVLDPLKEVRLAQVRVDESVFDFLDDCVWFPRPEVDTDASLYRSGDARRLAGFILVRAIPPKDAERARARFTISTGADSAHVARSVSRIPEDARREFLSLVDGLNADSALALSERLATVLESFPEERKLIALLELIRRNAIDRLPLSLQHRNPRYSCHLDQAIPIADQGVFLQGWFNVEASSLVQVVCHCGSARFPVSDNWVRQPRADVSAYLIKSGIAVRDHDHGYTCFVPLYEPETPYYLSAVSAWGEVSRMMVPLVEKQESDLGTVRALLSSFNWANTDLRSMMDRHIGPAVGAVWAARRKPARVPVIRNFGARPANPAVSVIVPLYGRHDFAEFHMALLADDPEFQNAELIYVVDDPAIVKEFFASARTCTAFIKFPL